MREFKCKTAESKITQEMLEFCQCSQPTIVRWVKEWQVDGEPLGFKRGGRWIVNVDRLNKFMRGAGDPRADTKGGPRPMPIRNEKRINCKHYDECLDTAARFNKEIPCSSCDKYEGK
jgi:hypothetical protein